MFKLLNVNGKSKDLHSRNIHSAISESFQRAGSGEWYLVDALTGVACLHFFM